MSDVELFDDIREMCDRNQDVAKNRPKLCLHISWQQFIDGHEDTLKGATGLSPEDIVYMDHPETRR